MGSSIALDIQSAFKTFGGNGARWALWKRRNAGGQSSQTVAVNSVSLSIRRGEILGVLGPNIAYRLLRCECDRRNAGKSGHE